MINTVNIIAVETRNGRMGYSIKIYDNGGQIVRSISGAAPNPNALDRVRFHVGAIHLPGAKYVSQVDKDELTRDAQEKGKGLEERSDGALSIADRESNFLRSLRKDERDYLEKTLGVNFERILFS